MKRRILSLVLALVVVLAGMPLAAAQRTLDNPDDTFTQPEAGCFLFDNGTWQAGLSIARNVFEQLMTGTADVNTIMNLVEQAPLVRDGDELPPKQELSVSDFLRGVFAEGYHSVYIALRELSAFEYQFIFFYYDRHGEAYWTELDIGYDAEKGFSYGTSGNGILGIGFEYEAKQFLVRASAQDSWQRRIGYSIIFDLLAPVVRIDLNTMRFPFAYNGKDYMIQIWKGSYFVFFNGAEIGLYEKPSNRPIFWDCSDSMLEYSMRLYQGDNLFFDYDPQYTWWVAGFRFANARSILESDALRMEGSITFEDQDMLDAFAASFEKNKSGKITGSADGMTFTFDWQAG